MRKIIVGIILMVSVGFSYGKAIIDQNDSMIRAKDSILDSRIKKLELKTKSIIEKEKKINERLTIAESKFLDARGISKQALDKSKENEKGIESTNSRVKMLEKRELDQDTLNNQFKTRISSNKKNMSALSKWFIFIGSFSVLGIIILFFRNRATNKRIDETKQYIEINFGTRN